MAHTNATARAPATHATTSHTSGTAALADQLAPVIQAAGCELYDLAWRASTLSVQVAATDGGLRRWTD